MLSIDHHPCTTHVHSCILTTIQVRIRRIPPFLCLIVCLMRLLYDRLPMLFLPACTIYIYYLLVYYHYCINSPPLCKIMNLVFENYLIGYELAMIMSLKKASIGHIVDVAYSSAASITASPSRSSLRKLVKGGNAPIFLSIRSAIPFRARHRFPFEHGPEQSPPWK